MDQPLLSRDEVSQMLFAILDIRENTKRIRDILEEDGDGEDAEEEA